ncbi:MAG TPA: hypothetical protein VKT70_04775 [Stellaceae bacterium]|nr:hypothetical protein [Stellaceae bacterium]
MPGIENRVEATFLRPVLLGESILPYRIFRSFAAVIPVNEKGEMLDALASAEIGADGLQGWMRKAEAVWNANAESGKMTLTGRWNYHSELSTQFPIPSLRVVYAASGSQPAACLLRDVRGVVEHMLYWMKPASVSEARFLIAILNSETARARSERYQSRGQFGARHFDKVMFNLPIPAFDPNETLHVALAEAAAAAEKIAALVKITEGMRFQQARGLVRAALTEAGISPRIDELVAKLLGGA